MDDQTRLTEAHGQSGRKPDRGIGATGDELLCGQALGFGKVSAGDFGQPQARPAEIGLGKSRAGQIRAGEVGGPECGLLEMPAAQVRAYADKQAAPRKPTAEEQTKSAEKEEARVPVEGSARNRAATARRW